DKLPWHKRAIAHVRLFFLAFTLKLPPARRAIYGVGLLATIIGLLKLFRTIHFWLIPHPVFETGTLWLLAGFLLVNLLVLLEVADRLSLKNDLEIAREIQQAMLSTAEFRALGVEAFGITAPIRWRAISTTFCRSLTGACYWRLATSRGRAAQPRC